MSRHFFAKFFSLTLCLCSELFFLTLLATAQGGSTGALRGTITDPAHAAVRNAIVAVVNTATGITRSTTTDSEGRYFLDLLPPRTLARAESPGLSPEVAPNLHLDVKDLLQLDFALSVAGTKKFVTPSPRTATR